MRRTHETMQRKGGSRPARRLRAAAICACSTAVLLVAGAGIAAAAIGAQTALWQAPVALATSLQQQEAENGLRIHAVPRLSEVPKAPSSMVVRGTIIALDRVAVAGEDQPHVFALIQTAKGHVTRVDLGPAIAVHGMDLRVNDRVQVEGDQGTINGRRLLVATVVESEERRRPQRVAPAPAVAAREREVPAAERAAVPFPENRFQGDIVSTRTVAIQGHGHDHLIADVLLDDGRILTVDLGPSRDWRALELKPGEDILIVAHSGRIDGRPALIASHAALEGGRLTISRAQGIEAETTLVTEAPFREREAVPGD